jgi:hypothetical protein
MTSRILDAAAETLYNARLYLAKVPNDLQYFSVNPVTNQLVNEAIPLLFLLEYQLRSDAAHH